MLPASSRNRHSSLQQALIMAARCYFELNELPTALQLFAGGLELCEALGNMRLVAEAPAASLCLPRFLRSRALVRSALS